MPLPRPSRSINNEESIIPEPGEKMRVEKKEPTRYRPSDTFHFDPKPELSAYELGQLLTIFFNGIMVTHTVFEKLPENLQRYFRHIKSS